MRDLTTKFSRHANSQVHPTCTHKTFFQWIAICLILSIFSSASAMDPEKMCTGTTMGFSSNSNDYLKWKAIYTNCIYVDGNIEINSFAPYDESNEYSLHNNNEYDFSFLDNIREITGYLLIHNNKYLKTLKFKNLRLIRGKSLLYDRISLYVENNKMLETLDLTALQEIQRGGVYINDNERLCHTDEVNWRDLSPNQENNVINIDKNASPLTCPRCKSTCSNGTNTEVGCWFPYGCQKLTKVVCHSRCEGGRCFGTGPYDCCNSQCLGGCDGGSKTSCVACTKLRMKTTGECVETCPRVQYPDPITGELVFNPNGMYQYGITCVKSCPKKSFIFKEFCLKNCPKNTYEEEEFVQNPETGEKGMRRFCKPCTATKCMNSCSVEGELSLANIGSLAGCHILKSNLIITNSIVSGEYNVTNLPRELNENDLQVLSSLRIINGYLRVQSEKLNNLSFLRNLETIRANSLVMAKYSMLIISNSLRSLNLNKLKSIESGIVRLHTKKLCLYDTINWQSILNNATRSFLFTDEFRNYTKNYCAKDGYVCDEACSGCWSIGPKACQICKTYKLDDTCVQSCDNTLVNGTYTYVHDVKTRECRYCHPQCKFGCTGPSEYECNQCANYFLKLDDETTKCVNQCPPSHYVNSFSINSRQCLPCHKDCYGCTGPKDTLGPGGCSKCSSALVDNDADYSIIKCVEKESFDCIGDGKRYSLLVPQSLKSHPLIGKKVCRNCNAQCNGCIGDGVKLNRECTACTNLFSSSTGDCVASCSFDKEYLETGSKVCQACNSECVSGCFGPGQFECKKCRTYQFNIADAETIITATGKTMQDELNLPNESFDRLSVTRKIEYINRIIMSQEATSDLTSGRSEIFNNVRQYYTKKLESLNSSSFVSAQDYNAFCVSSCPPEFPYKNADNFCAANPHPPFEIAFAFLLLIVIGIFFVLILFISLWQRRIKIEQLEKENEEKFFSPDFNKDNNSYDDDSNKQVNMSNLRLIKLNELELGKVLGRGAFGIVYEGYYRPYDDQSNCKVRVAIKVLNKCKLSDEKAVTRLSEELINEAKVMASVDHEYCLRLTALCLAEPMMMVTQLMQHGSVVSFYQKYRDLCTEKMLLTWAKQIAEGMNYLESRGIVHRDLAARNILVKKFDQIKITDFGLARILDSSKEGIYVLEYSLVPFKWLAIESIKNRLFNHKSDVWSYGICLWEIFTFCSKPYAEYPETDPLTIFNCIVKGTRLAKPQMASLDVYTILLRCWLENPIARPDFKTLSEEFGKMCMDPKRYLSIDKSNYNQPFRTIDENTQDLLQEFKIDYFDAHDLSTRKSDSSSSDKNSNKSLSKEDYIDPETSSSGYGDSSSNNDKKSDPDINANIVKTFKRTQNNLKIPNGNPNLRNISFNSTDTSKPNTKNYNNKKRIRKFFGFPGKPKRLDSENSTGTNSTYLSYSCSSVSTPSPRNVSNYKDKKNLNFNYYEEQEELLNNTNTSYGFSSSTASRSNSNSTHSTHSGDIVLTPSCQMYDSNNRCNSIYKAQRSGTQTSDYLEPIITNVMQNFEYFGEDNEANDTKKSAIIIMPDVHKAPITTTTKVAAQNKKSNYYNEDMSSLLKKHLKTTEI